MKDVKIYNIPLNLALDSSNNYSKSFNVYGFNKTEEIIREIWEDGFYSKNYKIKQGDIVIDIGANQGIFALYAASKGAIVYCFEPDKDNFELLKKNVEINKLENKIFIFNLAVSDINGEIDFFIPVNDKICTTALITTSKNFKEKLLNNYQCDVDIKKVKSINLKSILENNNIKNVDLLKIDCEGGEIEILKSDSMSFLYVKNIVMETHPVYHEKDLVEILTGLGYYIQGFKKINSKIGTGYIFAAKDINDSFTELFPVPVIDGPDYCIAGEEAEYKSINSINFNKSDSSLDSYWLINGVNQKRGCIIKFKDLKQGFFELGLIVSDKASVALKKSIWVFDKEYFDVKADYILENIAFEYEIEIHGSKFFNIPKKSFPKDFDSNYLIIMIIPADNKIMQSDYLMFNGIKYELEGLFSKIFLPKIPEVDVHFSLNFADKRKLKMLWWAEG